MDRRYTLNYQSFKGTADRLGYVHAPDLTPHLHVVLDENLAWFSDHSERTDFYFDLNGNSITLTKQSADNPTRHTLKATLKSLDIERLERLAHDFNFPFDREAVIIPED